jgi:SLOG in TRPM, prokaryote
MRQFSFDNGQIADSFTIDHPNQLTDILPQMGFQETVPTLVLVGGASRISPEDLKKLEQLFVDVLAPMIEKLGVVVVDGGTDVGIMRFIGQARTQIGATFPLIGVAPLGTVILPKMLTPPMADAAPLEPNHTHFILIPGNNWGDESPWIADIATLLSGESPSVTLVINGGEITWQDVAQSVRSKRPIITLEGSGRTADQIAIAARGQATETTDKRAIKLVMEGKIDAINMNSETNYLAEKLCQILYC